MDGHPLQEKFSFTDNVAQTVQSSHVCYYNKKFQSFCIRCYDAGLWNGGDVQLCTVVELSNHRMVEWYSCVVIESSNCRMVELSSCRIAESSNGGMMELWICGDVKSSNGRKVEL